MATSAHCSTEGPSNDSSGAPEKYGGPPEMSHGDSHEDDDGDEIWSGKGPSIPTGEDPGWRFNRIKK